MGAGKYTYDHIKIPKVTDETKIREIPTPSTSNFVSRRATLGGKKGIVEKAIRKIFT
jgi:acyl-ACP thioesterase|tara:strand:- start:528 stop:698 length:171 start_codon:yes stop_codon:yes gene_type:complete